MDFNTNKRSLDSRFIIIVNGTSSVGKTTFAKLLLDNLHIDTVRYVGVDSFVDMLPQYLVGDREEARAGFFFSKNTDGVGIEVGKQGEQVIASMHLFVKALVTSGLSAIVDHVLLSPHWAQQLQQLAADTGVTVVRILVTCSPDESSRRERARGNRRLGLESGLRHVENNSTQYDFVIDSTAQSPEQMVAVALQGLQSRIVLPEALPA